MVANASIPTGEFSGSGGSALSTPAEAPFRIDRVIKGKVSGPVPWVLSGYQKVWAWDQTVGLVRLTGAEEAGKAYFDVDCLTPDGRFLYYPLFIGDTKLRVVFDLSTGEWTTFRPEPDDDTFLGSYPRLGAGQRLEIFRYNKQGIPSYYLNCRYVVVRGDERIELPIDDHLTRSSDGPSAQFSPSGDLVAISHRRHDDGRLVASVVDINTMHVTRYEDLAVSTCGSWSPSSRRILLRGLSHLMPSVVDRTTGSIRPLNDVLFADPAWRYSDPLVSGWLDETRVMISGVFGRRIIMGTLDVDTGERVDLLDLPKPSGSDSYRIRLAPLVAQADPGLIGPLPRSSS